MKNTLGLRVSYLCTDINYHPSNRHHWQSMLSFFILFLLAGWHPLFDKTLASNPIVLV